MSEYINESTIQRIKVGREGENSLTITVMDDEVQFSIKDQSHPVCLTKSGFEALLTRLLEIDVGGIDIPAAPIQVIPRIIQSASVKKSALPENIDDLAPAKSGKSPVRTRAKSTRVPWSDKDEKQLVDLVKARRTVKEIGEIIGRTEKAVGNRKLKLRLTSHYVKKPPRKQRRGGIQKLWTEEEAAELLKRVLARETDKQIGKALGRSDISIRDRKRSQKFKEMMDNATKQSDLLQAEPEANHGAEA